jgi:hypothetical protein
MALLYRARLSSRIAAVHLACAAALLSLVALMDMVVQKRASGQSTTSVDAHRVLHARGPPVHSDDSKRVEAAVEEVRCQTTRARAAQHGPSQNCRWGEEGVSVS